MNNLNLLTDDELVKLFETGNNNAFEILLQRYKSKAYTYIYLIVRNRELAEDIFQDTFIKAISTIQHGKYFASGKFLAWVNRIAHNLIIDHFRRLRNENTVSVDAVDYEVVDDPNLTEKSFEDILSNEQVLVDVVQLIDCLPKLQQNVVRMRYFEDLSFKEIADKTGVSINTALGRMRYALLNIRRIAAEKNLYLELK